MKDENPKNIHEALVNAASKYDDKKLQDMLFDANWRLPACMILGTACALFFSVTHGGMSIFYFVCSLTCFFGAFITSAARSAVREVIESRKQQRGE